MSRDIGSQWEPLYDIDSMDNQSNTNKTELHFCKEISSLKADIWSLKSSLSDSIKCSNNLQIVLTNTVQEKYELIEEINVLHKLNEELLKELSNEREQLVNERRNLLNEMYDLRDELHQNQNLVANLNIEHRELKKSLYKAQETIHKIGNMFLKLKSIKKCNGSVPLSLTQ